jgi:hypothetical protein
MMEDRMGLAERRAVERFKNEDYPGWKERIDRAVGFDVEVEVIWAELAVADYTDRYAEFFAKVYFQPLVDALSATAADQMGREAVRDGLSKIVVRNSDEYGSTQGIAFSEGVLTIDHKPYANVDYGDERAKTLQHVLEAGL